MILKIIHGAVRAYQATLSGDHGLMRLVFPYGVCRYTPTCSQYFLQAIHYHGARGVIMGLRRLLRCHPFSPGGFDPVTSP